MKKTLFFLALLTALFSLRAEKTCAQVTGISLVSSGDTFYYYGSACTLPFNNDILVSGTLTGTVPPGESTTIYINWGDGSDTTIAAPDNSYGASAGGNFYTYANHTYTIAGIYAPEITATDAGGATAMDTLLAFSLSDSCGTLSGILYVDTNADCLHDTGEIGIPDMPIWVVDAAIGDTLLAGWSDNYGYYAITLTPGNYTVIPGFSLYVSDWYWWWGWYDDINFNLVPECPSAGSYSLTVTGSTSATENFAYTCKVSDTVNLQANGWNMSMVPGYITSLDVWAGDWYLWWDYTCANFSTTVTLTLDPHLTYVGSYWGPAPTSVSGSIITWNVTTAHDFLFFFDNIEVACDTTIAIGDSICNTVYIAPPAGITDPDLADNTDVFCREVTASFDPNEKGVSPQGKGTSGYIANNTPLTYSINFQNTGTAAANNITVDDTLSANVDMTTFHLLHATAPVTIYTSGNTVKFRFSNINLPCKSADPTGSTGDITYAVMPKHNLPGGTTITGNAAGIYFDYNPAVVTNTTLNTIIGSTGIKTIVNSTKISVYPNPADEQIFVTTDNNSAFTVNITDLTGRTIYFQNSANGEVMVNTSSLPPGMYLVKTKATDGSEQTTKVTVMH